MLQRGQNPLPTAFFVGIMRPVETERRRTNQLNASEHASDNGYATTTQAGAEAGADSNPLADEWDRFAN